MWPTTSNIETVLFVAAFALAVMALGRSAAGARSHRRNLLAGCVHPRLTVLGLRSPLHFDPRRRWNKATQRGTETPLP